MSNRNIIYKALIGAATLLATLFMSACSEENDMDAFFNLSKSEIAIDYKGLLENQTKATFEVGASQSWKVVTIDEWITLNHTSGERGRTNIFVTAPPVGIHGGREGSIVIKSGKELLVLTVAQAKKNEELVVTPKGISVGKSGLLTSGDKPSINITTNSEWRIEPEVSWIIPDIATGEDGSHEIALTIEHNNTIDKRKAYVMIYSGELKDSIEITQTLDGLKTSIYEMLANKDGLVEENGNTFTINSATPWTTTADSWITLNPASGIAGSATVTATLASYVGTAERSGKIIIRSDDGLETEVLVTQSHKLVVYEDDGKAVGYRYLLEDFEWCRPFGADDQVSNPATYKTVAIYGNSDVSKAAKAAFEAKKYLDFKPSASCMYIAAHYLKMNKGNNQTGLVIPSIPNLESRRVSNIKLSFDVAPNITAAGKQDVVDITVEIVDGPGSVDVNDGTTKLSVSKKITVASFNEWDNMDVVLYGVTSSTKVVIRTTKQGESGNYRWFLDNVTFEKHSIIP